MRLARIATPILLAALGWWWLTKPAMRSELAAIPTSETEGNSAPATSPDAPLPPGSTGTTVHMARGLLPRHEVPSESPALPSSTPGESTAPGEARAKISMLPASHASSATDIDDPPSSAPASTAATTSDFDSQSIATLYELAPEAPINYRRPGGDFHTIMSIVAPAMEALAPWPDDYPTHRYELIVIKENSHQSILIGENWIGDGARLTPISPQEYGNLREIFDNRRAGPGPNRTYEDFQNYLTGRSS